MALDSRIIQAINEAVDEAGQPVSLAHRLIAWFEALTIGNEEINDAPATARHLEILFEGTKVEINIKEYDD
ncbi:MAG: hypothetical protein OXE56_04070 [Gammaproteobacteria bacterium]|nr:hypothetical protein [Gammaproteobacteria bacterium]